MALVVCLILAHRIAWHTFTKSTSWCMSAGVHSGAEFDNRLASGIIYPIRSLVEDANAWYASSQRAVPLCWDFENDDFSTPGSSTANPLCWWCECPPLPFPHVPQAVLPTACLVSLTPLTRSGLWHCLLRCSTRWMYPTTLLSNQFKHYFVQPAVSRCEKVSYNQQSSMSTLCPN